MAKTDAVQRRLVSKVICKLQGRGFKLVAMKMMKPSKELIQEHYAEHKGKPFYEALVGRMTVGPVVAMVWEGDDVIATTRTMIGATDPAQAAIGTLRGDYGLSKQRNGFHGSDCVEAAQREIALWFTVDEVLDVVDHHESWIYEGPPKKAIQTVVPKLDMKKVTETPSGDLESGQRSAMRKYGIAGLVALGVGAIIAGAFVLNKKKN